MVSALMYKNMGIADAQITFWTSLVMLPWTLKPLWGPVLEMFKTKKHFVVGTQFIGGVAFGFLALTLPLDGFFRYSLALFAIIAFNGATHDIAADGVYINVLTPKLQAQFVGWQGAAYNIAKVFTQGALVYLAGQLETRVGITQAWMTIMGVYGAILIGLSLYHAKFLPSGGAATHGDNARRGIRQRCGTSSRRFSRRSSSSGGYSSSFSTGSPRGRRSRSFPSSSKRRGTRAGSVSRRPRSGSSTERSARQRSSSGPFSQGISSPVAG